MPIANGLFYIKTTWLVARKGHFKLIFQELFRRIYSNSRSYGFKRDLNLPVEKFESKIPLSVRKIRKEDFPVLLNINEPDINQRGIEKRLIRHFMLKSGIETCYVAVTQDGTPCHMQWLLLPNENVKIQRHFGGEIPILNKDEAMLEYVFTLEKYRRQRAHLFMSRKLFEKAKSMGVRWVIVFVKTDNEASLISTMRHGFVPYVLRIEKVRLFKKKYFFEELDAKQIKNIESGTNSIKKSLFSFHKFFYSIKPLIPRNTQIFFRRRLAGFKRNYRRHQWPINPSLGNAPEKWSGWPGGKKFALVLQHDVDTQKGYDSIPLLIDIEKRYGLKSSFNIVPERYQVHPEILEYIREQGFEINVHGLKHDGKLFKNRTIFNQRAVKINGYLEKWDSRGFTVPSMICNLEWLHDLNIDHSTATVDTDPYEPDPTLSHSIFPFVVNRHPEGKFFIEIPLTMPQDHTLFIILKEKNILIWKEKLKWIFEKGGMALMNTHPDYMSFGNEKCGREEYPVSLYSEFLEHVLSDYEDLFWNTQPGELAQFWKQKYAPVQSIKTGH